MFGIEARFYAGLAQARVFLSVLTFVVAATLPVPGSAADIVVLEIAKASVAFDLRTNEPLVSAEFTPASRIQFTHFTETRVGRVLETRLDGKILMRPVLRQSIVGGKIQILVGGSKEEAERVVARLAAADARLEIEAMLK